MRHAEKMLFVVVAVTALVGCDIPEPGIGVHQDGQRLRVSDRK